MNFKIPWFVVRSWDWFEGQINKDLIWRIRIVDVFLLVSFLFCVGYYWWFYNWQYAIYAGILYGVMMLTGFFFRDYG